MSTTPFAKAGIRSTLPGGQERIEKIRAILEENRRRTLIPEKKLYLIGKLFFLRRKGKKTLQTEGGPTDDNN